MMDALKSYLESNGYANVSVDFMPDEKNVPEVVYLGLWNHELDPDDSSTGTRHVQIQVRRRNPQSARIICNEILALLDSGLNEEQIHLAPGVWCIARPSRGARILTRGSKATTYYAEIALWGQT